MAKKEVIRYLRQKISEGYSLEQVSASLRQKGYSEKEIRDIVGRVVAGKKITSTRVTFSHQKILFPIAVIIAIAIGAAFLYSLLNIEVALRQADYREFRIAGSSMLPTLSDGRKVFLDESFYSKNPIKRGDIIALKLKTQEKPFVKRVIALSGDRLEFRNGRIYLNDEQLEEPYLYDKGFQYAPQGIKALLIPLNASNSTVPKKTLFVLGDNRAASQDSTEFGFLPEEYVVGKVVVK